MVLAKGANRLPVWQIAGLSVVALGLAGFALLPGNFVQKAYLALHGLCAQEPRHTLALGGTLLPFDARMTGLYLGAVIAGLLPLFGRWRGTRLAWPWWSLLAAGVVVMGLDGLNSLRVDLGWSGWWAPTNTLRLVTGYLAGLSLGVALVWLVKLAMDPWSSLDNQSVGRPTDSTAIGAGQAAPLLTWVDPVVWVGGLGVLGWIFGEGAGWALWPMTVLLLLGAVGSFTGLNLSWLGLLDRASDRERAVRLITIALTVTLVEIALLAGGRLLLEASLKPVGALQ